MRLDGRQITRLADGLRAHLRRRRPGLGPLFALLATLAVLLLTAIPLKDPDLGWHPAPPAPDGAALARIEAIQQRIRVDGMRWQAGPTGISHLPPADFAALLGAIPPDPSEWDAAATAGDAASGAQAGAMLSAPVPLAAGGGSQYLPSRWDWRDLEGVTPARHQGGCGGCWAFAAVGAFESLLRIYDDRSTDLSEQQVLDCNTAGYGCTGGWMTAAYRLWRDVGALAETALPYRAEDGGPCPTEPIDAAAQATGWTAVPTTQVALKHALLVGPLAVGMHVYPDFQHYQGGVYEHDGSEEINHAVLLVGWDDELGAWILKNSWGPGWGEGGYAYVAYGTCRLGSYPHRLQIEAQRDLRLHHTPVTDFCADGQPLELRVVVAAMSAALEPGSVRLILDQGAGEESQVLEPLTLDAAAGVFRATLPALPPGTRVRYYFEAADSRGNIGRYPEDALREPLVFHVLRPVYATTFETDPEAAGWIAGAPGDDATSGFWELGRPEIILADGGLQVQPDGDHTATGERCFVTGAAAGPAGDSDVDGGTTTLISPAFDLAGYEKAVLEVWFWFMNQVGPRPFEDTFLIEASSDGGQSWTAIHETRDGQPAWQFVAIPLHAHLPLSDNVRIRFLARDPYTDTLIEAAVDDVRLLAPAPPEGEVYPPTHPATRNGALALATGANPSRGQTELVLTLAAGRDVRAELLDATGRLVRTLWQGELPAGTHQLPWNGRDDRGRPVPAGRYWAQVVAGPDRTARALTVLR